MRRYIGKRLFHLLVVLIGVSVLSFLLVALGGKDPAEVIARRTMSNVSPEVIEALRGDLGLDGTLIERYGRWLSGLITGRTPISTYSFRPIGEDIAEYLPVTLSLVGLSLLLIFVISLPLSLLAARFRGRAADHLLRVVTILCICIPSFWLGFMLLSRYAVAIPLFSVMPEPGIKGYILPALALAIPASGSIIRMMRASLLTELSRDYVEYARSRGLSPARILVRHVLRNAMPPIVTVFVQYMGALLAGAAAVESVFSLPGLGTYLIACVVASDAAAVATSIVLIAAVFVLGHLGADIAGRLLCPALLREDHG